MWDNGVSLCFITNAKAKAQKLKGTEVQLIFVKVGGKNATIKSQRYILPLFVKDGQEVKFTVYEIDKITSNLQHVNIVATATVAQENTYMDDIIESVNDLSYAKQLASDIENLLIRGGFELKACTFSGDSTKGTPVMPQESHTTDEKILGVKWNPILDYLCFSVKLDFSTKKNKRHRTNTSKHQSITIPAQLMKRTILSQVNSIHDPLGLASPFTVRVKMMMRQIWASNNELGWDDPVPEDHKNSGKCSSKTSLK